MTASSSSDYIFTWKSEIFPHSEILKIIEEHDYNGPARRFWRCANHRATLNSGAYFLSQEPKFRGIFATGRIVREPKEMEDVIPGLYRVRAEIEFEQIVDPYKSMLTNFNQLIRINPENDSSEHSSSIPRQWRPQQSGEMIKPPAAAAIRSLIRIAERTDFTNQAIDLRDLEDARHRVLREIAARRGQERFRAQLMIAYEGKCAITGCAVAEILEAAHIIPFRGHQSNIIPNGLILRSDIHTLFDCGLLGVDPVSMSVIISNKVDDHFYRSLVGKKINTPAHILEKPSIIALDFHRKNQMR